MNAERCNCGRLRHSGRQSHWGYFFICHFLNSRPISIHFESSVGTFELIVDSCTAIQLCSDQASQRSCCAGFLRCDPDVCRLLTLIAVQFSAPVSAPRPAPHPRRRRQQSPPLRSAPPRGRRNKTLCEHCFLIKPETIEQKGCWL